MATRSWLLFSVAMQHDVRIEYAISTASGERIYAVKTVVSSASLLAVRTSTKADSAPSLLAVKVNKKPFDCFGTGHDL